MPATPMTMRVRRVPLVDVVDERVAVAARIVSFVPSVSQPSGLSPNISVS